MKHLQSIATPLITSLMLTAPNISTACIGVAGQDPTIPSTTSSYSSPSLLCDSNGKLCISLIKGTFTYPNWPHSYYCVTADPKCIVPMSNSCSTDEDCDKPKEALVNLLDSANGDSNVFKQRESFLYFCTIIDQSVNDAQ